MVTPMPDDQASLVVLPNELVVKIAGHLHADEEDFFFSKDTRYACEDIANLSLVSKTICATVQATLYKTVYITSIKSLWCFCESVEAFPDRASMVQYLALSLYICGDCEKAHEYPQKQRREGTTARKAIVALLSRASNLKRLYMSPLSCNEYESFYDDFNTKKSIADLKGFIAGFPPSIGAAIETPGAQFLPRLDTLYFANTRCPLDLANYSDLHTIPSLKRIICLDNPEGDWDQLQLPGLVVDYPQITALNIQDTGACPRDLYTVCQLFPSLQTLKISTCTYYVTDQLLRRPNSISDLDFDEYNLANGLGKLQEINELSLNVHWPEAESVIPNYTAMIGPTGGLHTLSQLSKLTKLTIGMHMLLTIPGVNSNNEVGYLDPASVFPSSLRDFTLYHCHVCSEFWYPTVHVRLMARSIISDLAAAKIRGSFPHLQQVHYLAEHNEWYDPLQDRTMSPVTRSTWDGKAWSPGRFVAEFDLFQAEGVHFEARQSSEYCC